MVTEDLADKVVDNTGYIAVREEQVFHNGGCGILDAFCVGREIEMFLYSGSVKLLLVVGDSKSNTS